MAPQSRRTSSAGLSTSGLNDFDMKLWDEPYQVTHGWRDDDLDSRDSMSLARPDRSLWAGGSSSNDVGDDGQVQGGKVNNDKAQPLLRVQSYENSSCDTSGTSIYYQRFDEKQYYFTVFGNYHYQSPECITGMGYDHSEDWWAVGVLTFHLLAGITPFEAKEGSHYSANAVDEKDRIVTAHILWENIPKENVISPICHDFIQRMLQENRSQRLFCQIPTSQVQEHQFFDDINFNMLFSGKGPIELELKGGHDYPYFEEHLDEDAPSPWTVAADEKESVGFSHKASKKEDPFKKFH